MIRTRGRSCASPLKPPPWKKIRKVCIDLLVVSKEFDFDSPAQFQPANKAKRPAREPLFTIRTQPLGKLTTKFWETARPDRLPDTSHGVKEEGQIMVGQENTRQHFPSHM